MVETAGELLRARVEEKCSYRKAPAGTSAAGQPELNEALPLRTKVSAGAVLGRAAACRRWDV